MQNKTSLRITNDELTENENGTYDKSHKEYFCF